MKNSLALAAAIPPGRRPSAQAESQNGTRDQGLPDAAPVGAPLTAPSVRALDKMSGRKARRN
jgi:hypothetical protein